MWGMATIKTEAVELIGLRYDKEKRKYRALFEVLNMILYEELLYESMVQFG